MTKIKMLNDRIIFDGHADSRQKCETITLMCDNLAKSKDFKTVRYESGYAEFEKVGKTDELKFRTSYDVTINFDSHIEKVFVPLSSGSSSKEGTEWTTSGKGQRLNGLGGVFTVTLTEGYVIDTITGTGQGFGDSFAVNFDITDNTFTFSSEDSTSYNISITSKLPDGKQKFDMSALVGWLNLSSGEHSITIKTKTSDGAESESSNIVTITKAVAGHTIYISNMADEEVSTISLEYNLYTMSGKTINGTLTNTGKSEYIWYNDIRAVSFTVDCGNEDNPWKVVISELGLNIVDTASYLSKEYTLTEDVTMDFATGNYV